MKRSSFLCLASFALAASATLSEAAISMVNTASSVLIDDKNTVMETTPQTISFNAGATADAIVLLLSSESNAEAGQVSITYAGFAFTPVIDHVGSQPSIWLLNLSTTTYTSGSANLVLDMTGVVQTNGYGLGIVSVTTGDALLKNLAVHATNISTTQTVDLTTTDNSFVIAGHRANAGQNAASANSPMTQIFGAQIGSSQGAAGYRVNVPAGNPSFSFTSHNTMAHNSSAAAFVVVPEPSVALLGGLGALFLLRRRR